MAMAAETVDETHVSQIEKILTRSTRARDETRLLDILRPLDAARLAATLDRLDLRRLLQALDDRMWGPKSRKEFLRVIVPALPNLSLRSKASLIGGLANSSKELAAERTIVELFLAESGQRLSDLKLLVDCAQDGRDLLNVLYSFIGSADLRYDVIQHFQKATETSTPRLLRVVSDIDDTIFSSLKDQRYPKGTIYPGVLELLSELSPLPPVFLTARPELVASLFERVTHKQLAQYGIEQCTVLSGSLPGLMGHRRMVEQKARTLTSYRELYPEYRFLFVGDSGQGDMALAEQLLSKKNSLIERALIHKLAAHQPGSKSSHPRIHTFENYAFAATILGEHGYLTEQQVKAIEESVT
jgi:Phosphatidate phosphatase APP1, catalytic domain